jgi:tetratricopeptide (TPR) repeat protein
LLRGRFRHVREQVRRDALPGMGSSQSGAAEIADVPRNGRVPLSVKGDLMKKEELLERYEALGEESDFVAAKPLYEQALTEAPDARLLNDYGYLLFAHARLELRRAVELYEQAIELDPGYDKPHYQLILARVSLLEPERPVAIYEQRLAVSPRELREYRFLAAAYLRSGAHERALETVEAGLELARDDAALLAMRGEAKAGLGDPEGALADWRRALELEPQDIGALYSSAFLLEREGRLEQAIEAWRSIIAWHESRGYTPQTVWPKRELERLRKA